MITSEPVAGSARRGALESGPLALNGILALRNVYLYVLGLSRPNAIVSTDFTSYWTGWWMILHGRARQLYDPASQLAAQRTVMGGIEFEGGLMAFLYPPHVALVGLPLGWLADHLGERAAFAVWSAVNVALVARLDHLITATLRPVGRARWMLLAALLAFYPVWVNLALGQVSLLLAVAAFQVFLAVRDEDDAAASAWLLVLSVKPQMLPPLLVLLLDRRRFRLLGRAAALGLALVAISSAVLGAQIWAHYLRGLRGLESFFGPGPVEAMSNLRGTLHRLLPGAGTGIEGAAWLAGIVALFGLAAWLRLGRRDGSPRPLADDFAVAVTVGMIFSPHLFTQDVALVLVPLVLHVESLRQRALPWRGFAGFALGWPLLFALTRLVDRGPSGQIFRLPIDPIFVALVVLLALLMSDAARTTSTPAASA